MAVRKFSMKNLYKRGAKSLKQVPPAGGVAEREYERRALGGDPYAWLEQEVPALRLEKRERLAEGSW